MRIAVLQPHLDDAVFSVGEHMLARPDDEFWLITPATSIPLMEPHQSKYNVLRAEHADVCRRMGWQQINGGFVDDAVPPNAWNVPMTVERVEDWLHLSLGDGQADEVWAPFGIRHPDHRVVAEACRNIAGRNWCWYEELPYRVDTPMEGYIGLGRLTDLFGTLRLRGYNLDNLESKRRLCHTYASQIGPDVERSLYVHERLWEVA